MKSKIRYITKEQQEYRDTILKKRIVRKNEIATVPQTITREEYMSHCLFWIKQYYACRTDRRRLLKATTWLKRYCDEILSEFSFESVTIK